MESPTPQPNKVKQLSFAADAALAMLAGMQLDVFTPLKNAPKTAEELANTIGVGSARLRLLLYCLVAAELLTEQEGRFSNTPDADQFLVKGSPSYMGNMHASLSMRWSSSLKTAESIRTGAPQGKLDFSHSSERELESFLRAINVRTVSAARGLVEHYDFASAKTLVDVGSGGAGLAITITKACPHIQASAIDLPQVAPIAQKIVEEEGATDRVKVIAANVVAGPLPGSYDVAVLRGFLQVLSSQDARLAVKHIAGAVNPGGKIYIIGQILDNSRTAPLEAVGFNLAFINAYDAGESYTESEHRAWLTEAGFVNSERANFLMADGSGLLLARKPV